jgi:Ca-activated chloride channel family protein
MKTSVLLDHEPVGDGGFLVRALLRMEGEAPQAADRVPLNLSLVLDRSGSMSGEPIAAAREAACMLVRRLRMEDTVSVVAFDHDVHVAAPPATGEAQEDLTRQIASIEARGSTNLSGGWLRGTELVASKLRDGGVNRVILLTDGQANAGVTDPEHLTGLTRAALDRGVTTTTIGFGSHFNEDLLRGMADAGRGSTYYIERTDQASGIFEEELEGLLSLAAQNIRVTIRPGADADFVKVAHDYPSHAQDDVLTLEVGDLYAREPRRVLMEFLLGPDAENVAEARVAELEGTAQVLTDSGGIDIETIRLPITLSPEEGGRVHPEVRKEALLLEAARARREALEARHLGDFERGRSTLSSTADLLTAWGGDDGELLEEVSDLRLMEQQFAAENVTVSDVKYMKQRMYDSSLSRPSAKERYRRTSSPDPSSPSNRPSTPPTSPKGDRS